MVSFTLRNIPEEILKRIRIFAIRDRRSLNSEMLVFIENGLNEKISKDSGLPDLSFSYRDPRLSQDARSLLWRELSGKWKDSRPESVSCQDVYFFRDGYKL